LACLAKFQATFIKIRGPAVGGVPVVN